jgi:hypothetical protein
MGGSVDLIASFSQRLATCVQRKRIRVDHGILAGLDELSSSSSETYEPSETYDRRHCDVSSLSELKA